MPPKNKKKGQNAAQTPASAPEESPVASGGAGEAEPSFQDREEDTTRAEEAVYGK